MKYKYTTETLLGKKDVSKTIDAIKEALIINSLTLVKYQEALYGDIYGYADTDIKDFTQPIIITDKRTGKVTCVFNKYQVLGDGKERDTVLNILKSNLFLEWVLDSTALYKSDYRYVGIVFVKVITNTIARNYRLDPEQALAIELYIADYYASLLNDSGKPLDTIGRMGDIMKFSNVSSVQAERHANKEIIYTGIEDLCANIALANISLKLKKFNLVSLLTLVGGITYGRTAKEDMGIALEYPPLFNWLLYRSISNVSYRNSLLTKTALVLGKNKKANALEYVKILDNTTKTAVGSLHDVEHNG